jgi:acetyl-CoA carboxylase biotin carboxyl carrier protein
MSIMKKIKEIDLSPAEAAMAPKIDYAEINKIIKLLEDRNLAEFELEIEGFKIKIRKNNPASISPAPAPPAASFSIPSTESAAPSPDLETEAKGNAHLVASPIVGIFYRAPSPNAPSFVEVGDAVKKKQTLCIVEAMKLMNEIESDVDGVVKEIFVENGKSVEYGQKLFSIAPLP